MEQLTVSNISSPEATSFQVNGPQNRYEVLNPSELAASERSNAKNYKIKAFVALGIGLFIFAAAITLTAVLISNPITATIASIAVFCFGAGIYKTVVKNKIFTYYRDLQGQAEAKAQTYEGYAESIKNLKTKLQEKPRTSNWSQREWNLAGMASYWSQQVKVATTQIDALDASIGKLHEDLNSSSITLKPEDRKKLQDELTKKRWVQHDLREGTHLNAKVNAAFFTYLLQNPHETREEGAFFTVHPISLLESDSHEIDNLRRLQQRRPLVKERAYLTLNSNPNIKFYRGDLRKMKVSELSRAIFERQKAA
ncbi:MAG: hypothetical protein KFB95_07285 [Simkaniaceae bacterium]|nr:MAG: hypothetical protein KFB95_07285 [Simkaniaceae bacterium]